MNAIDTNVWVYSHDKRDEKKQRAAQQLIATLQSMALLWQVGCEFIAAARKHGKELQRAQAVQAACSLLEEKPFVCRSRMITALGKCGKDAEPAIPILQKLTRDHETSVREAAIRVLGQLTVPASPAGH